MKTFGLVGKSLTHSFSKQYFTEKFTQERVFDAEYQLFSLQNIEEIKELLKHPTLLGFNVTIPYKNAIIPFLDELDSVVQEIGAVNCVIKQNGRWVGYNTDVIGFEETIKKLEVRSQKIEGRNSVLILGSGGAAKAVCYVLKQRKIPYLIVSRKKTEETITYDELTGEIINHYTLIINTTPLGMFPHINEKPPIPYSALHREHILIDLIYNPEKTLFLKEGKLRGAFTINGLTMFLEQAEANWEFFSTQMTQITQIYADKK